MDAAAHDRASRAAVDLIVTAADGGLDLPVRSCPGWTMADLLFHSGNALLFWGEIAAGSPPRQVQRPVRPADPDLVAWVRTETARYLDDLAARDPAAEAWTFTDDRTVGWIQRRMTHELAVHAWDATDARGEPRPLEPEVAVDGIDEFLDVWLASNPDYHLGPMQTVHLHATDGPGEWLVTVGEGDLAVARRHGEADVELRGTASDLVLALWGRIEAVDGSAPVGTMPGDSAPGAVELVGDRAELDRFLARTAT